MLLILTTAALAWTLAFGSCQHQDQPSPGLVSAAASRPDAFVFLGDNLYNDVDAKGMLCEPIQCHNATWLKQMHSSVITWIYNGIKAVNPKLADRLGEKTIRSHNAGVGAEDMKALAMAYATLGERPEMATLRAAVPEVLATWDDHDFCRNDAGASCPWADESQAQFLAFWRRGQPHRTTRGVYEAYTYQAEGGRSVQVLLLDMRSFRADHILPSDDPSEPCNLASGTRLGYCVQTSPNATLLGAEQWAWLEAQLSSPADVRIIGTSMSLGAQYIQGGDEVWGVFPHERARLFALLRSTQANGVLFISGDLHYGEINVIRAAGTHPESGDAQDATPPYTIHELLSSGLTMTWPRPEVNAHRIAGPVMSPNWGAIAIDFEVADPTIELRLHDAVSGASQVGLSLRLSDLRLGGA